MKVQLPNNYDELMDAVARYDQGPLFADYGSPSQGLMQVLPSDFGTFYGRLDEVYRYTRQQLGLEEEPKVSQKTFCDLCDEEIANYRIRLNVEITHTTKTDEVVGVDEYGNIDVCRTCAAKPVVLLELITKRMRLRNETPLELEEHVGQDAPIELQSCRAHAPEVFLGPVDIQIATALEHPLDNSD